jgi:DHA1 family bicyclomycin/chloramphenicol resistance-like MFS transporter
MGAFSTILGGMLATPISLMFDGTALPLIASVTVLYTFSFGLMLRMRRLEHAAA